MLKAFWVLGGNKTGVMSIRGKWAFEEKGGIFQIIKETAAGRQNFDEVMKAASRTCTKYSGNGSGTLKEKTPKIH